MTSSQRDLLGKIAIAGQCVLIVMGVAWAVLERPAPVVTVRWRDGLSEDGRHTAERQLLLRNAQPSDEAWQYELWSPRQPEIEAIVGHPDVEDTQHIDRGEARVASDAGRGQVRVWWAGPFRGARSRLQFRVLFAAVGIVTLACGFLSTFNRGVEARRPGL